MGQHIHRRSSAVTSGRNDDPRGNNERRTTIRRRGAPLAVIVASAAALALYAAPPLLPVVHAYSDQDPELASDEPHPDPNEEHHEGMIYVGRVDDDGRRTGFDVPNGVKYIFGTAFDESHRNIEEKDLHHEHFGADVLHDMPDRSHTIVHEKISHEKMHIKPHPDGPKPFGYVDTHPLDGGVTPPKVVNVDPFFMDETPVTNKQFAKFVKATYYETEAEQFGWSFVLNSFLPKADSLEEADVDPEAEHWVAKDGAYWRAPEGPGSTYKLREHHPVVHVSHRDSSEYCKWLGKRLPGEREWEAAARAGLYGPKNRTLYSWGDNDDDTVASKHVNYWQGDFPWKNDAMDGWRGTNPVRHYPSNRMGFHDLSGNVWEWQRGGKHKARIIRGGSYVDSLDGSFNHAVTLGARATLHGTTGSGNVGFRCVKSPKRRTEYMWVYEGQEVTNSLSVENPDGSRKNLAGRGNIDGEWIEDDEDEDDEFADDPLHDPRYPNQRGRKKKKVVKPRTVLSNEL